MERDELKAAWNAARAGGTFLTRKHDPNYLHEPWRDYRTVLTHQMAAKLDEYLEGDDFDIECFENAQGPYCVVAAHPNSEFSVPASGVASGSNTPHEACDRLVVVSGTNQGWHCFGERSEEIQQQAQRGHLVYKDKL